MGDGEEGQDLVGHREERACWALRGDGSRTTTGEEDVGVGGGDQRRRPQGAVGFGDTLVGRGIRGSAQARETSRLGSTSGGGEASGLAVRAARKVSWVATGEGGVGGVRREKGVRGND